MAEVQDYKNYRSAARAHANVAIAKYWGKRDEGLNLPLFDSISLNIEALYSETTAIWHDEDTRDALVINGWQVPSHAMGRIQRIIDKIREIKGWDKRCTLKSVNNFPLATGLASSAAGCAAATLAAAHAAELCLPEPQLSAIARLGSGSAARSIPDGWALWHAGCQADGSDSFAESIAPHGHWPLHVFVIQVSDAPKVVSSTECMKRSMQSPFWDKYVQEASKAAEIAKTAILQRNFSALAEALHRNTMMLHAMAMTCQPPVCYFAPKSIEMIQKVLRASRAVPVCCTLDAGPNVIVLCEDAACPFVKNDIIALGMPFIQSRVGSGAAVVS